MKYPILFRKIQSTDFPKLSIEERNPGLAEGLKALAERERQAPRKATDVLRENLERAVDSYANRQKWLEAEIEKMAAELNDVRHALDTAQSAVMALDMAATLAADMPAPKVYTEDGKSVDV